MFGKPRRHYAECGSTNDLAREWAADAADPAPSGALVTANFQTRGRGRRGHAWQADAGQSALMSFVYRLPPSVETGLLGLTAALAIAAALESLGFAPQIKWPNDILLGEKKVGGVLVEVAGQAAVLGVGVNVNQTQFAGAAEFAYPPTSLRLNAEREQSRESVIDAVGQSLTLWERRLREDRARILDGVRERLAAGVTVRRGDASAALTGLTERGEAVVQAADGTFAVWATVN